MIGMKGNIVAALKDEADEEREKTRRCREKNAEGRWWMHLPRMHKSPSLPPSFLSSLAPSLLLLPTAVLTTFFSFFLFSHHLSFLYPPMSSCLLPLAAKRRADACTEQWMITRQNRAESLTRNTLYTNARTPLPLPLRHHRLLCRHYYTAPQSCTRLSCRLAATPAPSLSDAVF